MKAVINGKAYNFMVVKKFCWIPYMLSLLTAVSVNGNDFRADTAVSSTDSACFPVISIVTPQQSWSVCLNYMVPPEDSCGEVIIDFGPRHGIAVSFLFERDKLWHYNGTKHKSDGMDDNRFSLDVLEDSARGLLGAVATLDPPDDSAAGYPLKLNRRFDLPEVEPIDPPPDFTVFKRTVKCGPPAIRYVVENRVYTYPPCYGHREPVLNYPELSMFHYGRSVRMPTAKSLRNWAEEICLYHVLHPKPFTFDDPEEIMRSEAWRNKVRAIKDSVRAAKKKNAPPPVVWLKPLYH